MWKGDRLRVEDVRFLGNYPLIAARVPPGAVGVGVMRPAIMLGGILTYYASDVFGRVIQPQTVVFRPVGPDDGTVHAIITFDGPPEGSPRYQSRR